MNTKRWTMRFAAVLAVATMAFSGAVSSGTGNAFAGKKTAYTAPVLVEDGAATGTAQFGTDGGAVASPDANTIPHWSSSFSWNGTTYPYTMVGTNPSTNTSTTIHTWIIPLKFVFDPASATAPTNPLVRDGSQDVNNVLTSPIFQNNPWNTFAHTNLGTDQYGDAVQRVEFNKVGTNYHVYLQNDKVLPTVTINVPKQQAQVRSISARISASWFSAQEQNLMSALQVPSTVVPIFLTHNTFLYEGVPSNCCILGWHGASSSLNGAGKQQVQTYMFSAYSSYGLFCGNSTCTTSAPIADIHALSHEVSEWLNDPFVNNVVPAWSVPFEPQYGCTNVLEAGDPLVGFSPNNGSTGWHPQDIPLAPWFERQPTPGSLAGTYTYPDTATTLANEGATGFDTYSPGC